MSLVIISMVLAAFAAAAIYTVKHLIHICAPNEVLVFSGSRHRAGNRTVGYRVLKGGRGTRVPLLERVDRMDLTNMAIEVTARNAYSKGGVPLTVHGVANVKIAGHSPVLNHAIERMLGKSRGEVMQIAKATLEGALRGVLATLTPEQVNEDRLLFAERLVQQVEHDMTALGLVVDTLKIQNVSDEVRYLDSIGRKKNAEVLRRARMAEAVAHADAVVRSAQNQEREVQAEISAAIEVAKAEAMRKLADIETRRGALVAEEHATVAALVAQALAEVDVQKARVEQVRSRLQAEVIEPARAACAAAEANAKAEVSPVIQDGEARAEALTQLAASWKKAGSDARQISMLQKLDKVIETVTDVVGDTRIRQVTMIDSRTPSIGGDGSLPMKALGTLEQVKHLFGVDLSEKLGGGLMNRPAVQAPKAIRAMPASAPAASD
jgi:flotillin